MSLAKLKSWEIITKYQTNNPYQIAESEKIDVIEQKLAGRLTELYFGDHVILNKELPFAKKRQFLAHALGHHYLHAGNYIFLSKNRHFQNDKEEAQADEFAAHLLIPETELIPIIHHELEDLADNFQVQPEFIKYRLSLIK